MRLCNGTRRAIANDFSLEEYNRYSLEKAVTLRVYQYFASLLDAWFSAKTVGFGTSQIVLAKLLVEYEEAQKTEKLYFKANGRTFISKTTGHVQEDLHRKVTITESSQVEFLQKRPVNYMAGLLIGEMCLSESCDKIEQCMQSMSAKDVLGYVRVNDSSHPALVVDESNLGTLNSSERKLANANHLIAINGLQGPLKCRKITSQAVIQGVTFENTSMRLKMWF